MLLYYCAIVLCTAWVVSHQQTAAGMSPLSTTCTRSSTRAVAGRLSLLLLLAHVALVPCTSSLAFLPLPPSIRRCEMMRRLAISSEGIACCDDSYVDIAAHYLVPVLFRDSHDGDGSKTTNAVEAEKALKRCLRQCERVWRNDFNAASDAPACAAATLMANLPSSTQFERQSSRKRLSDMILGTSVMRLRHWFVLDQQRKHKQNALEPIVGVEPWMVDTTPPPENSTDATRMEITRELVRLHAQYLLLGTNNTHTTADDDVVQWPTDTIRRIATQQSLPSFIVRLFVDQYGPEEAGMLSQLANRPGPITLRRNAIRCESDELLIQRLWEEDEIKAFAPVGAPSGCIRLEYNGESSALDRPSKSLWSTQAWGDGWFEVQDVGSQFIVDSVDVGGGDCTVVDFCAGNGGKTLALASRMWEIRQEQRAGGISQAESATIIAHDIVGSRLKQIEGSLARAGLGDDIPNNCLPKIQTTFDATSIGTEVADAVLVDAPCSSLGVLRRRPGHRWALTEDMITREFPSLQLDILTRASQLVKPGGKLIYATCSVSQFENKGVVDMFQSRERYGDDWITWEFDDNGSHCRSILPHVDDCDGFFVARWKKRDRIK